MRTDTFFAVPLQKYWPLVLLAPFPAQLALLWLVTRVTNSQQVATSVGLLFILFGPILVYRFLRPAFAEPSWLPLLMMIAVFVALAVATPILMVIVLGGT